MTLKELEYNKFLEEEIQGLNSSLHTISEN